MGPLVSGASAAARGAGAGAGAVPATGVTAGWGRTGVGGGLVDGLGAAAAALGAVPAAGAENRSPTATAARVTTSSNVTITHRRGAPRPAAGGGVNAGRADTGAIPSCLVGGTSLTL